MSKSISHVIVVGLRGIPDIQGGVETHVQHLFPAIARAGIKITVLMRTPYVIANHPPIWGGINLVKIWSPRSKTLEAVVHTFLAVLYAGFHRPDILHIHAIGPALFVPLARLLGLKVVVTHHGADYDRQKWGFVAKTILRLGEAWGMRFASRRIAVSRTMQSLMSHRYGVDVRYIPNGVNQAAWPLSTQVLEKFGLAPRRYILLVSRMVPEKRHLDLIQAFARAKVPDWKLVLVGGSDHPDAYLMDVQVLASKTPHVVMTGVQTGEALHTLYAHAGLFVLPSSHEGLPIALLEALSYGLPALVSDIAPHVEVGLPSDHYFKAGDVSSLHEGINRLVGTSFSEEWREATKRWVFAHYNWEAAAHETMDVYRELLFK